MRFYIYDLYLIISLFYINYSERIFCIAGKSIALIVSQTRNKPICQALRNIRQYLKKGPKEKKGRCLSHRAIKHCAGYDINDLHHSVLRAVSKAKVSGFRSARDFCTWRHVAQIEAFAYTYIHTYVSISAYLHHFETGDTVFQYRCSLISTCVRALFSTVQIILLAFC